MPDRQAFFFQLQDRPFGERATFCVPRSTLEDMRPGSPFDPVEAFDALRSVIYSAALERVRLSGSVRQHVITAHELRIIETTGPTALPARRQPDAAGRHEP